MPDPRTELIRRIHLSPTELVLAVTGGGSPVIGDLLSVPGGSKTLLEATVPYAHAAIDQYMGRRMPEHYCCERSARMLAMAAFQRGRELLKARDWNDEEPGKQRLEGTLEENTDLIGVLNLIGVGCTASLSTDREKKGDYRVHVATQTFRRTTLCTVQLAKGKRTRAEEERLVADLILNMIENARSISELPPPEATPAGKETSIRAFSSETTDDLCVEEILPLDLGPDEPLNVRCVAAMPPLVDLFFGQTAMILWRSNRIEWMKTEEECKKQNSAEAAAFPYNPYAEYSNAIFSGSFNPIHRAHREMIDRARNWLSCVVSLEISVLNARKPPMDYMDLYERLAGIENAIPGQPVWLTRAPFFHDKAGLFPGATFVVGADTLRDFADPRCYDDRIHVLHDILRDLAARECRFLVFAREDGGVVESLDSLSIPDMLRCLSVGIPPEEFCVRISSTELRCMERQTV